MKDLFKKNIRNVKEEDVPRGNNNLDSFDSFFQNKVYEKSYPGFQNPETLDFHDGLKALYGKVDGQMHAVMPKVDKMTQILSEKDESYFVLDFVNENFQDMVEYYEKLKNIGKVQDVGVYREIQPVRAWTNPEPLYQSFKEAMFSQFSKTFVTPAVDSQIKNYSSFEKVFLGFMAMITPQFPFTRTEFLLNIFNSPMNSGLAIEISNQDCSYDYAKFAGFLKDPNYQIFTRAAKRFGFKVDKNAPWRLICDLKSPFVKERLVERGILTFDEIFQNYYDRTSSTEVENLKDFMLTAYNAYVRAFPQYQEVTTSPCSNNPSRKVKKRYSFSTKQADDEIRPSHWIRLMAYTRSLETSRQWEQAQFDFLIKRAYEILLYKGEKVAYNFVESHFTDRSNEVFQKKTLTKDDAFDNLVKNSTSQLKF
jgi:hypothetical protein